MTPEIEGFVSLIRSSRRKKCSNNLNPAQVASELAYLNENYGPASIAKHGSGFIITMTTQSIDMSEYVKPDSLIIEPLEFSYQLHYDGYLQIAGFVSTEDRDKKIFHPNIIGPNVYVCLGAAADMFEEFIRHGDLVSAYDAVMGFLKNYNPNHHVYKIGMFVQEQCVDCQDHVKNTRQCPHCKNHVCEKCVQNIYYVDAVGIHDIAKFTCATCVEKYKECPICNRRFQYDPGRKCSLCRLGV